MILVPTGVLIRRPDPIWRAFYRRLVDWLTASRRTRAELDARLDSLATRCGRDDES